jgi:hypothetical protein
MIPKKDRDFYDPRYHRQYGGQNMFGKKKQEVKEEVVEMPEFNFPEGSKATLVVILEKESLWSKAGGRGGTFNLLMADRINMQIDDEPVVKIVRKKPDAPFEFELKPGPHMIEFFDPNAKAKNRFTVGSMLGFMTGAMSGSVSNAISGYAGGMRSEVKYGVVQCFLNPEDVLTVSVKCTSKGDVKLKIVE